MVPTMLDGVVARIINNARQATNAPSQMIERRPEYSAKKRRDSL